MTDTADLTRVPTGDLYVRLSLAQTTARFWQTMAQRSKALDDITALRMEIARRGAE